MRHVSEPLTVPTTKWCIERGIGEGKLRRYNGILHVDVSLPISEGDSSDLPPCWILKLPDEVLANIVSNFFGQVDDLSGKEWQTCTPKACDWITLPDHQTLASLSSVCQRLRALTLYHLRQTAGVNVDSLTSAADLQHALRHCRALANNIRYLSIRFSEFPLYLDVLLQCTNLRTLRIVFDGEGPSGALDSCRTDLAIRLGQLHRLDTLYLTFERAGYTTIDRVAAIVATIASKAWSLRCILLENLRCLNELHEIPSFMSLAFVQPCWLIRHRAVRFGFRGPQCPTRNEFHWWARFIEAGGRVRSLNLCVTSSFEEDWQLVSTKVCAAIRHLELSELPQHAEFHLHEAGVYDASVRFPSLEVLRCSPRLWTAWTWPSTLKTLVIVLPVRLSAFHQCIEGVAERLREHRLQPQCKLSSLRFRFHGPELPGYGVEEDDDDPAPETTPLVLRHRRQWTMVAEHLEKLQTTAFELGIRIGPELMEWYRERVGTVHAALEWAERQNEGPDDEDGMQQQDVP